MTVSEALNQGSQAPDPWRRMAIRSGAWAAKHGRDGVPIGRVRARPKLRRQSRYVIRLLVILAERRRIVHRQSSRWMFK